MSDLSKQGGGRKPFSRGGKRGKKERKKKKPTLLWHLRGVGPGSINRPGQRTRAVAGQKEVTATSRHSFFPSSCPLLVRRSSSPRGLFSRKYTELCMKSARSQRNRDKEEGGRRAGSRGARRRRRRVMFEREADT